MPKFFLDLSDDSHTELDDRGEEFTDLSEAALEAVRTIRGLSKDVLDNKRAEHFTITVRDEAGAALEIVADFRIRSLRETPP
jgi:hypothetical protein